MPNINKMTNDNIWNKIGNIYHGIVDCYKRKPWNIKALFVMCTLFVAVIFSLVAVNNNGKSRKPVASLIYSADNKLIGKFYIDIDNLDSTENNYECRYFLHAVAEEMREWCEDNDVDFYRDGLTIYTTIDTRMQQYAEQAVWQQMKVVQQNFDREWGDKPCWVDDDGNEIKDFFNDKVKSSDVYKQLKAKYNENIDSVMYHMNKVHSGVTLIDYNSKSHYCEATMSSVDSIKHMLHKMHCGFIAMDPHTGEVKAWVGDVDYNTFKYDNVRAQHQPGSTFNLFVYSAALIDGRRPCDQYMDSTNQSMTMRAAFAQSNNIIAVKVGNDVGVKKVAQVARNMGIKSQLDETPSLCLGSSDVNLLELVNSYGTVVNEGQPKSPVLVTKITKKGEEKPIFESKRDIKDPSRSGSLDESQAYIMRRMLEAVCTDAGGTGQALNQYVSGVGIGGKTGTSNNYADAWFVAITPKLVCGTWVGGAYRQIHFLSDQEQGNQVAIPIVGLFLQKVLADEYFSRLRRTFPTNPDLDRNIMECSSIANPYQNSDGAPKTVKDIVNEDIYGKPKER